MTYGIFGAGRPSRRRLFGEAGGIALGAWLGGGIGKALAFAGIASDDLEPAQPFSFSWLQGEAQKLAQGPYQTPVVPSPDVLAEITYDEYQRIRYRADKSLKLDTAGRYPVQLFHLATWARSPVRIHVVEGGVAREVIYSPALFDVPPMHPSRKLAAGAGFAGFRVMAQDLKNDWFAALGASYFRASGPFDQYGISARGIAVNTAMPWPEEFPRFNAYWLEGPREAGGALTIYGLLDGPSLAGAYQMRTKRLSDGRGLHRIVMDIEATLYVRTNIERVGIAPFSSMYWYGEADRAQAADWRPEIHDSDGLAILTGAGERIWRPILNPPRVMTSTFVDNNVKGFGLMQRDRNFDHYLDDGVFYERRPSVWVEPLDPWGEGAVHLVEIPTAVETADNIVAYWAPKDTFKVGDCKTFRYRLSWIDDVALGDALARTVGTRTGLGGRPGFDHVAGIRKFVIDFEGKAFRGLDRDNGVELIVNASRGKVTNAYNHPVVGQADRWRAMFDIEAEGSEPVDLRAFLRKGEGALTETWLYQHYPETT